MTRFLIVIAFACIVLQATGSAVAQAYPNRSVRLVVPFPPGGAPDATARAIAKQLEIQMSQNFVIDNRAGANGIIAYDLVAKAAPDGYTLAFATPSFATNPSTYRKLPYDASRDFAPITNAASGSGSLILVNPAIPARTIQELIALAKNPDSRLSYGSPGIGNTVHLATELFNQSAGTHLLHVPYKGTAALLTALVGGEIQVSFVQPMTAMSLVKAGRVRVLAITGATRWPGLPDTPTVSEAAIPGFVANFVWSGWFAPAKTSDEIVNRIYREIRKALDEPGVREFLAAGAMVPVGNSPPEFARFVQTEIKRYAEIVRAAKIGPE